MIDLDINWARDVFIAVFFAVGLVITIEKGLRALGQFHRRGMERVRESERVWRECGECGWGDFDPGYFQEVEGENYCSLHR